MEIINDDTQYFITEKLIGEMKNAEDVLKSWNANWFEKIENFEDDDFTTVEWYDINTKKTVRRIIFKGNGDISLDKQSKNYSKKIHYNASYNVTSDDFTLDIGIFTIDKKTRKQNSDQIMISIKDDILTERLNDITIITDLETGKKKISINKDYDCMYRYNNMPGVNFNACLDEDGKIISANAVVTLHKRNGKVNGSYRFDANKEKGIRACYYTRKGKKIDMISNPMLMEKAYKLLNDKINENEIVVRDFANATQYSLINNGNDRLINFDYSNFSVDAINEAIEKIRNTVGSISGELPLEGLSERLELYFDKVNEKNVNKQKLLK